MMLNLTPLIEWAVNQASSDGRRMLFDLSLVGVTSSWEGNTGDKFEATSRPERYTKKVLAQLDWPLTHNISQTVVSSSRVPLPSPAKLRWHSPNTCFFLVTEPWIW